jgi:hypothetical protein
MDDPGQVETREREEAARVPDSKVEEFRRLDDPLGMFQDDPDWRFLEGF